MIGIYEDRIEFKANEGVKLPRDQEFLVNLKLGEQSPKMIENSAYTYADLFFEDLVGEKRACEITCPEWVSDLKHEDRILEILSPFAKGVKAWCENHGKTIRKIKWDKWDHQIHLIVVLELE